MVMNALVRRVLTEIGVNPDRFNLQWASAAEAPRFVRLITDFTMKIKELGPLGASEELSADELRQRLEKAHALVSDRKLRVGFGNVTKALRKEVGKLDDATIAEAVEAKLGKTIAALSA